MKVFFDSNVIIDALSERKESFYSLNLVKKVILGSIKGYLATKQITDIYYVLKRYGFTSEERVKLLKVITTHFQLLPTLSSDIKYSIEKYQEGDFEDFVIDNICKVNCCDYFVTSNTEDFKNSTNVVFAPKDLIAILEAGE